MSETQFTPGPWDYEVVKTIWIGGHAKAMDMGVIGVAAYAAIADGQAARDARLIAAAPTMAAYIQKRAETGDAEAQAIWEAAVG